MRDDHHGEAEARAHREDELVELHGAHRIEAGGGLVEEEQVGLEGHGPSDGGALLHAARDLGGVMVLVPLQAHEAELGADDGVDRAFGKIGPLGEGERHVLSDGHRAKERS